MRPGNVPGCTGLAGRQGVAHPGARATASSALSRERSDDFHDDPAAIERAFARVAERASAAYDSSQPWADRLRAALSALLEHFDEQPQLARLCVALHPPAGPAVLARRDEILAALARMIEGGRDSAHRQPPPHTAQGVLGGTLGAIQARLLQPDAGTLTDLVNPLMSFIVLPYLGAAASRVELTRSAPLH